MLGALQKFFFRGGKHSGELSNIRTHNKYRLATGQQQSADIRSTLHKGYGLLQLPQSLLIKFINRARLAIKVNFDKSIFNGFKAKGFSVIHRGSNGSYFGLRCILAL